MKIFSFIFKPQGSVFKWLMLFIALGIGALGILGHLNNIIEFLDSEALTFYFSKKTSISAYKIIKSLIILVGLFWITGVVSEYADKSIKNLKTLKSSNRAIISKAVQILIYFVAFLILMDMLEIDLKSLAIFSGAVGIGVGFGLQKITSNFISGLILLFEKSIRVDDLVELDGGVSGYLRYTGARYTLIEALDGKEIMVPNEDLITGKVTNWTYSHNRGRVEIPVGVAYSSDLDLVMKLMLEAASSHPKCLKDPSPRCFLRKFGDSSINFILYFWVEDVIDGRYEPQSDVMLTMWNKFKENGIEIPYPQMDVHLSNSEFTKDSK